MCEVARVLDVSTLQIDPSPVNSRVMVITGLLKGVKDTRVRLSSSKDSKDIVEKIDRLTVPREARPRLSSLSESREPEPRDRCHTVSSSSRKEFMSLVKAVGKKCKKSIL